MSRRGKVDMQNGWVLETVGGMANVATNQAEDKMRELPSVDGLAIFPSEVSTPLVQTESLLSHGVITGGTGVQAGHIANVSGWDDAALATKINGIITALENVGILAA
jgi:hypothetical protein